jgi:hypothetical protein
VQRPPQSNVINLSSGTSYECVKYGGVLCAKVIPVGTWSSFQSNINAIRRYKGLSDYPFTAQSMQSLYDKYNEAKAAICAVAQGSLGSISKGDKNIVATVNALEDQLNSIT